uniref:Putative dehydrogenase n=1 Tax=Sordaria macrospora TaxID=5147 RepID=C1KU50_SORMA|nr:putative dehydrogenase [Sordaria macrospora]
MFPIKLGVFMTAITLIHSVFAEDIPNPPQAPTAQTGQTSTPMLDGGRVIRPPSSRVCSSHVPRMSCLKVAYLAKTKQRFLATKAGGHGNSPTLGTTYNEVVQVNMENFRHVIFGKDGDKVTVTVGGGARMQDIIPRLHAEGREMTVGSFPCVGTHGVLLGGGMGRLMGKHGLMIDSLLRIKVALWNGTIVEASESSYPDLFWGIRGAGHNFGVVVESTFKTYPDEGGMHYNADMVFTDDSIDGVLETAMEVIEAGLEPSVFLILGYLFDETAMKPVLFINIVSAHDTEAGKSVSARFASSSSQGITRVHFNETLITFAELGSGAALPGVCANSLSQDLYTASSPSLFSPESMKAVYASYASFISANPAANRSILLFEAASPHVIASVPDDATAYPHRGKMVTNAIIQVTWDDESLNEVADAWGRETRNLLARPENSGYEKLYAYINYANRDEPLQALFGYEEWRWEKLSKLKREYDPEGYFDGYHGIPRVVEGWYGKEAAGAGSMQKPMSTPHEEL